MRVKIQQDIDFVAIEKCVESASSNSGISARSLCRLFGLKGLVPRVKIKEHLESLVAAGSLVSGPKAFASTGSNAAKQIAESLGIKQRTKEVYLNKINPANLTPDSECAVLGRLLSYSNGCRADTLLKDLTESGLWSLLPEDLHSILDDLVTRQKIVVRGKKHDPVYVHFRNCHYSEIDFDPEEYAIFLAEELKIRYPSMIVTRHGTRVEGLPAVAKTTAI